LEVIVVDDGSTDDSIENIEKALFDYKLTLISQTTNRGPAAARNAGARQARGTYLFFLDSDTTVFPETIKRAVEEMNRLHADAITGQYDHRPLNRGWVPEYKAALNYSFFSRKGIIPYEVFDSSRALIKRQVFESLGGFNESLKWGMDYENEEFGYRLKRNHMNYLVPSVAVRHHFPNMRALTRTYFYRVSLWMQIFADRKQFESGGLTSSDMGYGTAAILFALCSTPLISNTYLFWIPLLFWALFLKTYSEFYGFAFRRKGWIRGAVFILLNFYFSFVIGLGAVHGTIVFIRKKWLKQKAIVPGSNMDGGE